MGSFVFVNPTYISLLSLFNWTFCLFFVVGDLHGDLDKTRSALEIAGVLSSDGEDLWIGGQTVCLFAHSLPSIFYCICCRK